MSLVTLDELAQVNALRQRGRPSGSNEWDYAVTVLRTAVVLAERKGRREHGMAGRVAGVAEALTPVAWPAIRAAIVTPGSAVGEALEAVGVQINSADSTEDQQLGRDVQAVTREVEARRSAGVPLSDGSHVQVVVVSHSVAFIPEIYTGLCLLNRALLDTTIEAFPGKALPVWETLQERVFLYFGAEIDASAWRFRLRDLWRQTLRGIFTDQAEERFGPLSNVLLLATGLSQRAPLDYVPRPLIKDFGHSLLRAQSRLEANMLALAGGSATRIKDTHEQTRDWLNKNLPQGGYGEARKHLAADEALALHPAARLVEAVRLGTVGASTAGVSSVGRSCIYCGNAAEAIETPEMAEGKGVKKFSKRWIATGSRSFANLCARCSLASFLQLRLLGCYSSGGNVGPRRFFTVFHEGVYSDARLEFLGRWADAYYTLLREGYLIRQLGSTLKQKPATGTEESDEDEVDAPETAASNLKQNLKRLRKTLQDIQSNAGGLRQYLAALRERLPALRTKTGISVDEIGHLTDRLEILLQADPNTLDTEVGVRVRELVQDFLTLDTRIADSVAQPIVHAFRRKPGDSETGITVHDLGGSATSRLVLLALPVLPQAKKGTEWIDLRRHFSASRAAVTLTLGWLRRQYPGTYWWGMPIARDDGLIHTPYGVADERAIRKFEIAWTVASQIVPSRRAEYPQLLAWAEKLVDEPIATAARILRRQGDAGPSVRRLDANQLSEFVQEVAAIGLD